MSQVFVIFKSLLENNSENKFDFQGFTKSLDYGDLSVYVRDMCVCLLHKYLRIDL